jgi:hypothetical protein
MKSSTSSWRCHSRAEALRADEQKAGADALEFRSLIASEKKWNHQTARSRCGAATSPLKLSLKLLQLSFCVHLFPPAGHSDNGETNVSTGAWFY